MALRRNKSECLEIISFRFPYSDHWNSEKLLHNYLEKPCYFKSITSLTGLRNVFDNGMQIHSFSEMVLKQCSQKEVSIHTTTETKGKSPNKRNFDIVQTGVQTMNPLKVDITY